MTVAQEDVEIPNEAMEGGAWRSDTSRRMLDGRLIHRDLSKGTVRIPARNSLPTLDLNLADIVSTQGTLRS